VQILPICKVHQRIAKICENCQVRKFLQIAHFQKKAVLYIKPAVNVGKFRVLDCEFRRDNVGQH